MTAEVFGAAPDADSGDVDPLSPEHVVTLVRFLASPASAAVSGQVFVVYGPEVTLMAAPTVERKFSADGQAWDPAGLSDTLANYFAGRDPARTFSASELMAGA
jgi:3-oxoacyl-[acyl-carrier protein] reductase